jgi:hypothetical protein
MILYDCHAEMIVARPVIMLDLLIYRLFLYSLTLIPESSRPRVEWHDLQLSIKCI